MNDLHLEPEITIDNYSLFIVLPATIFLISVVLFFFKKWVDGPVYSVPQLDLKGKHAIVTGGNTGIGFQVVRQLALLDCHVTIGARNRTMAEEAIKSVKKIYPDAQIQFIPLDLADRNSIREFVSNIKSEKVDYLLNNAGIMGIPKRKLTKEGVEMQWAVNHLGHFYLTYLLWEKITKSPYFRIVNVSSRGHTQYLGFFHTIGLDFDNMNFDKKYDRHLSYSRSKLYNVLFTRALADRIDETKGMILSVNPGVVRTDIIRELVGDGIKGKVLGVLLRIVWPVFCLFTKSRKQGASTSLFALLSPLVKNGCYYTACKVDRQNSCVTSNNWNKLWQISEKSLQINFEPRV